MFEFFLNQMKFPAVSFIENNWGVANSEDMTEEELIALDEKIDNFILGKLSKKQEAEFSAQVDNDPGLQEKVKQSRLIRDLVIEYNLIEVRKKMRDFFSGKKPVPHSRREFPNVRRKERKKSE